jgi:WhiB family transcriptional regulator, redox-sensing transcriptional regulator
MMPLAEVGIPTWTIAASCTQVPGDMWFPDNGVDQNVAEVKAMCRNCPVRLQCLEYALANHEHFGIWGGLTVKERRDLRRQREAA